MLSSCCFVRPRPSALRRLRRVLATWPAVRYLVLGPLPGPPAPGFGEAAAGDHLQLAWAFWLPGTSSERGAAPWADPYSFRPEAHATPNVQGWLLGMRTGHRPAVRSAWAAQPHRVPPRRPRPRSAGGYARSRAGARCGARGRPRLCPGPVSGRPIDRAPARPDRVSASRDDSAPRSSAGASSGRGSRSRRCRCRARFTSPWEPCCSRPAMRGRGCREKTGGRQPPRPRRVSGRGARGAAGRGRLGRERRTAVRAGAVLFRRARGPVHAQCDARHREVRLSRLVDAGARARRTLGRAPPARPRLGPRPRRAASRVLALGSNVPGAHSSLLVRAPAAPVRARAGAADADRLPLHRALVPSAVDALLCASVGRAAVLVVAVAPPRRLAADLHVPVFAAVADNCERGLRGDLARAGTAPRAARVQAGHPFRERVSGVRTPVAGGAPQAYSTTGKLQSYLLAGTTAAGRGALPGHPGVRFVGC